LGLEKLRKEYMKTVDLTKVRRILIIRARAIGDVILTTPFIRAIKKALPNAEIDFLVEPFAEPALRGNPYLHNIIIFKRYSPEKELPAVKFMRKNELKNDGFFVKIIDTVKFYMMLRDRKYDLVFDLWGNLRTALLGFLTGARYRAGFNFRGRKYFYNIRVEPDVPPKYNVYYHMDLLKPLGIPEDGEQTDFFTGKEDEKYASDFLDSTGVNDKDKLVGVNAMGSWATKRWPPEKFSALADAIMSEYKDVRIILIWGPGELDSTQKIKDGVKTDKTRVFMAPETSIKQMGALIAGLGLLVTNDGAPKHIAVAVGTPSVTVYGPTNYRSWGPAANPAHAAVYSRLDCAPCDKMDCGDRAIECMKKVEVSEVFEAVKKVMAYSRTRQK
jgi:ADP-heptose:LPS heptosyltransferase